MLRSQDITPEILQQGNGSAEFNVSLSDLKSEDAVDQLAKEAITKGADQLAKEVITKGADQLAKEAITKGDPFLLPKSLSYLKCEIKSAAQSI
ncbi:hypothetical protein AVEN_237034-1 [Araneus ventricosus]|uniref:Uncharacterized protein n=1 Tax=Araneus ventricosus TaxID=182803 RepID=A0A4Y2Q074_ARAVE|nr:hypothetical protein AVEN_237034-1 [Araneus ventricosus]